MAAINGPMRSRRELVLIMICIALLMILASLVPLVLAQQATIRELRQVVKELMKEAAPVEAPPIVAPNPESRPVPRPAPQPQQRRQERPNDGKPHHNPLQQAP